MAEAEEIEIALDALTVAQCVYIQCIADEADIALTSREEMREMCALGIFTNEDDDELTDLGRAVAAELRKMEDGE